MEEYTITLFWDNDAGIWYATNDEIPMMLESESIDALIERAKLATPELLEMNGRTPRCILHFVAERKDEVA